MGRHLFPHAYDLAEYVAICLLMPTTWQNRDRPMQRQMLPALMIRRSVRSELVQASSGPHVVAIDRPVLLAIVCLDR